VEKGETFLKTVKIYSDLGYLFLITKRPAFFKKDNLWSLASGLTL